MPFSAGTVFLDVVPSFHDLQRNVERQTRGVGAALEKNVSKGLDDAGKVAGKKGAAAGADYVGAFEKRVRGDLKKAAEGLEVRVGADTSEAAKKVRLLAREIEKFSDKEISARFNGETALAQAREIEQRLDAIIRGGEYDVEVVFNAADARRTLAGIREQIQKTLGPTAAETAARVAQAKQIADAQKAASEVEANMAREAAQFRRIQAAEAAKERENAAEYAAWQKAQQDDLARLQVQAAHENRVFDAERRDALSERVRAERAAIDLEKNMAREAAQFRKIQAAEIKDARLSAEEEYNARALQLAQERARAEADLRAAVARQNETVGVAGRTGKTSDRTVAEAAIMERYAAEERAARAAANERIQQAAKGLVGELASHARAQQAGEEHYREVARAAAAAAATRMAAARLAGAVENARGRDSTVSRLGDTTGQAANSFRLFNGRILAAVSLGPLLVPILMSIAAGMGAIAVGAIGAVAGVGALIAGFGGVGSAVQALSGLEREQRKQSAGSGAGNAAVDTRGLRDAQRGLARAREDAGAQISAAARREADAQRELGDAHDRAGRQIADAARRQQDAQETLTDAVERASRAQRDLIDARRDAQRDLEDMNARLAAGALEEQLGAFALEEAGFRFNNVMEDPQASAREQEIARLEYEAAQQRYADMQRQQRRLETDTAAANAAGVEGAQQVVAAQEAIVDSTDAVGDAQRGVAEADQAAAQARIDAARMIADAEQSLADASAATARARIEEARTMADAERAVADAMIDLQLKTVAAGVAGSAAMDELNESMRGLSPAGQDFARFLFGLAPLIQAIRFAAQEGMLPGFQEMLSTIVERYGPGFITFIGAISTLIGRLAVAAGEALTSPFWVNFFEMVARYAPVFLEQFAGFIGGFLTMIAGIMVAFAPFAERLGDVVLGIITSMAQWGQNLAGSEGFADFMRYVSEAGPKVFALIVGILTIVLKLMIGLEPYTDLLLDIALGFVTWLAAMDPETLGRILVVIVLVVGAIQVLAGVMAAITSIASLLIGVITIARVAFAVFGTSVLGAIAPVLGIIAAVVAVIAILVGLAFWLKSLYEENETFRRVVDSVWANIVTVIQFAWGIISGIFNAWWTVLQTYLFPVLAFLGGMVLDVFTGIWNVITIAWNIIKAVFDMWVQLFRFVIFPLFKELYETHIKPVWEQHIQPIFTALGEFIEKNVAPAFKRGLDAIAAIWDGLKDIAKAPVRFVVDTVINKGIIDNFNKLVDIFPGMTKVAHVSLPASFNEGSAGGGGRSLAMATGGVLPGYTPGRDVHRFVSPSGGVLDLSGGEAILRPELTRLLGKRWIDQANAAARRGQAGQFLGGFADGGILGWLGRKAGDAQDAISGAVGGLTNLVADPGAALGRVVERLTSGTTGPFPQLVARVPFRILEGVTGLIKGMFDGPEIPDGPGAGVSAGGLGWQTMQGLVRGAFPSARFTSAFRPGAVTAVGTRSYHGLGRAIDIAPNMGLFNWISANYPNSRELFYTPAGAAQILNGRRNPNLAPVTRADHYDHIHWAFDKGGIVPNLYDGGGSLPPGLSVVANKTGRPEQVLTDAQWKDIVNRPTSAAGPAVQIMGDVIAADDIVDEMVDRWAVKQRDAAFLYQIDTIGVDS